MDLTFKKTTAIELIADLGLFLYLTTEILFRHTLISQLSLVIFVFTVSLLILSRNLNIKFSYYFVLMAFFIAYNWLNIKWDNVLFPDSSSDLLNTLILNFIILFFLYNYAVLRNDMIRILRIILVSYFFVSMYVVLMSFPTLFSQRLGANTDINANLLSIVSSISFLISLYFVLQKNNKEKRFLWFLLLWFFGVVILTGSRKGLFIVFFGCIMLFYLLFPQKRIKQLFIIAFGTSIIYLLIMYIPQLYNLIGSRLDSLINYIFGGEAEEASLKTRDRLASLGLNYFTLEPWFGLGLDAFRNLSGSSGTYTHNNFIEILVSSGIFGFIIYYSNYIIALVKAYKRGIKGHSIVLLMFTITLVMFLIGFASVGYYIRPYLNFLVLTIAFTKIAAVNRMQN